MTTLLAPSTLTEKMLGAYRRDGYVVISRLFAPDEIAILRAAAERDLPARKSSPSRIRTATKSR